VNFYEISIAPMRTNIKINGSNTRNQATFVAPEPQMRFRIQVQNRTYNILIANIKNVSVT
jgi:hypothetical protein